MIEESNTYELNKFINIAFQKQKYDLSSQVIETINNLNKLFNPNGTSASLFPSHYDSPRRMSRNSSSFSSLTRATGKLIERSSPIKKEQSDINQIRFLLNKLSEQNFKEIKEQLIVHIDEILQKEDHDLNKLSNLIFDLASTNSFYSAIYAKLFSLLLEKYDWLKPQFTEALDNCKNSFVEFRSCNPNENYNLYCEINKENEKRKSMSKFFVNLLTHKIVQIESLLDIQVLFLDKIRSLVEEKSNQELVNEIVENVAIFSQILNNSLDSDGTNTQLINNIKQDYLYFANLNIKTKPGMTNKSVFKFMDLYEALV